MKRYPSSLDPATLVKAITPLPTTIDAGNVDMAYTQGTDPEAVTDPYIRKAIEEIQILTGGKAVGIMVNTLKANRGSPIHTDTLKERYARYHLPVQTNKDAVWWDDTLEIGKFIHMSEGFWYGPVPYFKDHQVINSGDQDRIHIVVDIQGAIQCL